MKAQTWWRRSYLVLFFMTTVEADLADDGSGELAACLGNSVCGFLQANSKGINNMKYCNCTSSPCPTDWDPFDGKSITQSVSDQYKFCDAAPENLPECKQGARRPAYSSFQYYDKATSEKAFIKDEMHCVCPEGHNYLDSRYKFFSEGKYEVVVTLYYCLPLKECTLGEVCKEITDLPNEFLVNPKCKCPENHSCPTTRPRFAETRYFNDMALVHRVQCQRLDQHRPEKMGDSSRLSSLLNPLIRRRLP